jgi:hypothetical protein
MQQNESKQNPAGTDTDTGKPVKISKRQRLFIVALLGAKSIKQACLSFGLDRSQFYVWRKSPAFCDALAQAMTEVVNDAFSELRLNISGATGTLISLLNSKDENIQLRAANSLLEHYDRLIEINDFSARLGALESSMKQGVSNV